ncbi:MAG: ABC-F family ATP-binding cassette domain-containing protein [Bauldia sp.]|nr:ABC-F family ATP-binding cassette domain-containing protein [Bauldia sp.]
MLQIGNLTYRIGDRVLLSGASVSLPAGTRAGLVGRNGAGKTTLLKLITGELAPESGDIAMPRGARIGQVAQEAPSGPETLLEVVMAGDRERAALLAAAATETDPHRIAEIQTRLVDIGAHSAEARAGAILSGLGFDAATQRGPCSALSGGWRMRVALAAVLFAEPDLLLLDEPTNYLDLEGTLWLHAFLARYRHTVIVVSHDRDLLDAAVEMIVHIDDGKLVPYRGGYTQFDRQRRERQALQAKARVKQEAARAHMQAFVDRFRAKATKARQAQSRLKMLERMEPIAELVDEHVYGFSFPDPAKPAAPPLVALDHVAVGYGERAVLSQLDLRLDVDDRVGLLGQNGNGKSTFAKLISGRLKPMAGEMRGSPRLSVGYFAQHQLDELDPDGSAADHVRRLMPGELPARVRARTGALGFPGAKMDTPTRELSGGEKARLLLGLAAFGAPNLLILDEPTNHLDIDSREALIRALNDYAGAVIIISHDRHLLEATVDRLWLVADGTVRPFDGDLDDYRRRVLDDRGGARGRGDDAAKPNAGERRREAAQRREALAPMRKKIKDSQSLMARLEKEIQRLDALLADPALYTRDPAAAAGHARAKADAGRQLAQAEEAWLALSAEYEAADGAG